MIVLTRSGIAGEYRGINADAQLVLRVDVGQDDSLDIISGDLAVNNGTGIFEFHHSFQTTGLVLEDQSTGQLLRSAVKVYREDILNIARLDLTIPDTGDLLARYTFYRLTNFGRETAVTLTFPIRKTSEYFRRVELEVDRVEGIPLPEIFQITEHPDTPSTLPPRGLTFQGAYRDAGIDLVTTFDPEPVLRSAADLIRADQLWTDEELHAAMADNFSRHSDEPNWQLYLLLATKYIEPGVLGIMFDSGDNFPRQGAAVFYEHPSLAHAATEVDRNREYLYTIVHELGHAFNFLHAFQKGIFDTHGVLPRPASLSWMNYPQLYPYGYAFPEGWDGSRSFWSQFKFHFDREELAHIRHGDSLEVMMGGRSFGFAGHLEERPFELPTSSNSNSLSLSLTLWVPSTIEFMQQLEGDIRLRNEGSRTVSTHSNLSLSSERITLLIRRPNSRYPNVYRHFYQTCVRESLRSLNPGESVYQEIAPSFGLRHWFLDEPGTYEMQAIYRTPGGQKLVSAVRKVRVTYPSKEADLIASDFFTTDTGTYLGLEGSRSPALKKTGEFLTELGNKLPKNAAISQQIEVTQSLCSTRVFKDVSNHKIIRPECAESANHLIQALNVNLDKKIIKHTSSQSNLRLSRLLRAAASTLVKAEEHDKARQVVGTIKNMLNQVKAPGQATEELKSFQQQIGIETE